MSSRACWVDGRCWPRRRSGRGRRWRLRRPAREESRACRRSLTLSIKRGRTARVSRNGPSARRPDASSQRRLSQQPILGLLFQASFPLVCLPTSVFFLLSSCCSIRARHTHILPLSFSSSSHRPSLPLLSSSLTLTLFSSQHRLSLIMYWCCLSLGSFKLLLSKSHSDFSLSSLPSFLSCCSLGLLSPINPPRYTDSPLPDLFSHTPTTPFRAPARHSSVL